MVSGLSYAFDELLGDIGKWFIVGILIAGAISALVPPDFIENHLGDGIFSMLIMTAVAVPMYVCATSSTPIAAALALKGLSPGAALVFLLAGPATNAASLTVISKILGKKATAIYVGAIVVCSLAMGMAVNALYGMLNLNVTDWIQGGGDASHGIFSLVAAMILLGLILRKTVRFHRLFHYLPLVGHKKSDCCSASE